MEIKNIILNKIKTVTVLSFGLFLMSLVVQLHFTNNLAVKGKEMVTLTVEKEDLLKQISEMELRKSSYTSLATVESKAKSQGFIENHNYVSLISPVKATASIPSF